MRWLGLWIGLSVVALAVGLWGWWSMRFRFVALRARPLPGFEIKLPGGEVEEDGLLYRSGRLTVHGTAPRKFTLQLNWEPGGLFGNEQVEAMNRVLGAAVEQPARPLRPPARAAIPGAGASLSWAVALGPMETWVTQAACGARRVTMMTGSTRAGVEQLHRRVVASFRCLPDPAEEQTIGDIPVAFDLDSGWFRQSTDVEQLELTDRRTLLTARSFTRTGQFEDVARILTAPGALPGIKIIERVGRNWRIEMSVDDKPWHGWLTLRDCTDTTQILMLMSTTPGDDDGRRWLARARCRRPGEPPQIWPDLPRAEAAQ